MVPGMVESVDEVRVKVSCLKCRSREGQGSLLRPLPRKTSWNFFRRKIFLKIFDRAGKREK